MIFWAYQSQTQKGEFPLAFATGQFTANYLLERNRNYRCSRNGSSHYNLLGLKRAALVNKRLDLVNLLGEKAKEKHLKVNCPLNPSDYHHIHHELIRGTFIKKSNMEKLSNKRKELLHQIASDYVEEGLNKGNLETLPYHPDVEFRAPLLPGGSTVPVRGRKQILEILSKMLESVESSELVDTYVNKDLTAATVEFYCKFREPKTQLRVIDRFRINESGQITEQENFYDPRDISHAGWRN